MSKSLIIVESPTKIKTLKKFLGPGFSFASSLGHIRDLPQKGFGIDVEHNFEPEYVILPGKKEVIDNLRKAAKECDTVYLSPDPDREGEAIAWHIASILPRGTKIKRVTFNSITKEAVLDALKKPRAIDQALVDAQQARRLVDRIVGYKLSPLLYRKVGRGKDGGLSAGRVQSVALKLVVDREKEIEKFIPVEYWKISTTLTTGIENQVFTADFYSFQGKRFEKEHVPGKKEGFLIPDEKTAQDIVKRLNQANYTVELVEKKEKRRMPTAPFITSTLQQEASRHFGFSAMRTMSVAQSLYEGLDIGHEGAEGLITYMRTDSVRAAPEAIKEVRSFILSTFGQDYLPDSAKEYISKGSSQDAHEAIRPANLKYSPEKIRSYLDPDQNKLYTLIWQRFIASQMNPAIYDSVSVDIQTNQEIVLRATGSTIKFSGFLAIYEEKEDNSHHEEKEEDRLLPPLAENQSLNKVKVNSAQSFTRPPPRFSEASLVKELEKLGIGRPSTYASIMNKIQSRAYTTKEKSQLKPTELGRVITELLEHNFQAIMDVGFTAAMEDDLDAIADDKRDWKKFIKEFWKDFIPTVEAAEKEAFVPKILTDLDCPLCGNKLQKVWSKNKYFYGCSTYPECPFTAPIEALSFDKKDYDPDFDWDQKCPICHSEMNLRHGKFGPFLGCSTYPECKGIVNIPKLGEASVEDLPSCPATGCDGQIQMRRSRFGKTFYSCSNYPDCDVIVNDPEDLAEKYPNHIKTPYIKKGKKGKYQKRTGSRGFAQGESPTKGEPKEQTLDQEEATGMAKKAVKKATSKKKTVAKKAVMKKKVTKTKTASKSGTKKRGNMPSYTVSPDLAAVVGSTNMNRMDVTKELWVYIKKHKLQDTKNKRLINPDEKLAKVFGSKKPVDMLKMAGLLSKHLKS